MQKRFGYRSTLTSVVLFLEERVHGRCFDSIHLAGCATHDLASDVRGFGRSLNHSIDNRTSNL